MSAVREVAAWFRSLRRSRKLTQVQMAERMRVSPREVARYESGATGLKMHAAVRIARELDAADEWAALFQKRK